MPALDPASCAPSASPQLADLAVMPFARSLRSLGAERSRGITARLVLAIALLVAWASWLVLARVALVETSDDARMEVSGAAVPVAASIEGRVLVTHVVLGRRVEAGEALVELDARALRLARAEKEAERDGLLGELQALAGERAALWLAIATLETGGRTRTGEAVASAREAEIEAALARRMSERSDGLRELGIEADETAEVLRARQRSRDAVASIRRIQVVRTRAELREALSTLRVEIARLDRDEAELRHVLAARTASLARLDHELDQHVVRAPVAGTLGGAVPMPAGTLVGHGTPVAHVIPDAPLRVVGRFTPAAVGRIRPGQPARVRLHGYPWIEYGSLRAEVRAIASETEDDLVRVECELLPQLGSAIPVEHGLVGVLEVEVEGVSPATLLLRAMGRGLAR